METSKIKIRPFTPIEEIKREPFAVLKYGNVEIELDYTVLRHISFDEQSSTFARTRSIFNAAIEELLREMAITLDKSLPKDHRDSESSKFVKDRSRNPLHPDY